MSQVALEIRLQAAGFVLLLWVVIIGGSYLAVTYGGWWLGPAVLAYFIIRGVSWLFYSLFKAVLITRKQDALLNQNSQSGQSKEMR